MPTGSRVASLEASWYVYAVTASDLKVDLRSLAAVGESSRIGVIHEGPLAAVASPFAGEKVRPERRNLAAHSGLHRALLDSGAPFLPARFGLVAPSVPDVKAMLRASRDALLAELERLSGKVEMGLLVAWDVPNIFEFFVFERPELARLRDHIFKKPGGPTRDEKLHLGRTFEAMLKETRQRHIESVQQALADCVIEFHADPPREEKQVMNLSCLTPRAATKAFENAVLRAASLFDNHYAFDYNGPWPPYHFVRVSLALPPQE